MEQEATEGNYVKNDKPKAFWEMSGFVELGLCPVREKNSYDHKYHLGFCFQQFMKFSSGRESQRTHSQPRSANCTVSFEGSFLLVWGTLYYSDFSFPVMHSLLQLFPLYVNAKSAWRWLTYHLSEIPGRSQRRLFLKTTVILKPQKGLWHPQSYPCLPSSTWRLHRKPAWVESGNLGGSLWALMKTANIVIWLFLKKEGKSIRFDFNTWMNWEMNRKKFQWDQLSFPVCP